MSALLQTGQLTFRPGQALPTIHNSRPSLANILLRGKPAQLAPQQLPLVYTLCGESHRLAAQLAIDAASGLRALPTKQENLNLSIETAREHVRRIWLDWPRLFGTENVATNVAAIQSLRHCPIWQENRKEDAAVRLLAMRGWIETEVLGEALEEWLLRWQTDPVECLLDWVARVETFPAKLLRDIEYEAVRVSVCAPSLLVHQDSSSLLEIAEGIAARNDFERFPSYIGYVCETGVWSRLQGMEQHQQLKDNLWMRMGARIAELVMLSVPERQQLALGAIALSPGIALAWCEMARGLLLHWVRLDRSAPQSLIADYRVIAPTEWNFHPTGVVARALAALPVARSTCEQRDVVRHVGMLAAAFDPCVSYRIEFEHA